MPENQYTGHPQYGGFDRSEFFSLFPDESFVRVSVMKYEVFFGRTLNIKSTGNQPTGRLSQWIYTARNNLLAIYAALKSTGNLLVGSIMR